MKKEILSRKTGREYFLELKLKKLENGDKNDLIEDGLDFENKDDGNDEDIDYTKLRKEKDENKENFEGSDNNEEYEDFDHDIFKQELNDEDINFDDE